MLGFRIQTVQTFQVVGFEILDTNFRFEPDHLEILKFVSKIGNWKDGNPNLSPNLGTKPKTWFQVDSNFTFCIDKLTNLDLGAEKNTRETKNFI